MRILVCIKPVPDPETSKNVTIDPVTKTIRRDQGKSIIDPLSRHAVEAALRIKETAGGEVAVMSMAPPNGDKLLKEALAMGADSAWLLSDRAFAGGDTLATANVLAAAVRRLQQEGAFDLILLGSYSSDGGTAQVPAQLAELLGLPHFHYVCALDYADGQFAFQTDAGRELDSWQGAGPLLLSVTRKLNKPRLISIKGVLAAGKKPLTVWSAADIEPEPDFLGLAGSPTQNGDVYPLQLSRAAVRLEGSAAEQAAQLKELLAQQGVAE